MKILSQKLFALLFSITISLINFSAHSTESESEAVEENKHNRLEKDELELKKKEHCNAIRRQSNSALSANDWENAERLAKNFTFECQGVVDAFELSSSYQNLAMAGNKLGKYNDAIIAANECINAYYGITQCSYQKAYAQFALGEKAESRKSLDIAERLARHNIMEYQNSLKEAKDIQEDVNRDLSMRSSETLKDAAYLLNQETLTKSKTFINSVTTLIDFEKLNLNLIKDLRKKLAK